MSGFLRSFSKSRLGARDLSSCRSSRSTAQCIVLNADYSFLNVVDWKRAICLLVKKKVKVLRYSGIRVRTGEGAVVEVPAVLQLVCFIRTVYQMRVPFSRRNVMIRDGYRCAYCNRSNTRLTIDHLIPRSRGGCTVFENCVAACTQCNHHKGNRTPSEARMVPRANPRHPTLSEFLRMKMRLLGFEEVVRELQLFN